MRPAVSLFMPVSVDERVSTEPRLKRSSNSVDSMLPKFLCELLDVTALRQQAWPSDYNKGCLRRAQRHSSPDAVLMRGTKDI